MDIYEKAWAGKHGEEYTERCDVTSESREEIFMKIIDDKIIVHSPVDSILEVGCNKGHNLQAIYKVHSSHFFRIPFNGNRN